MPQHEPQQKIDVAQLKFRLRGSSEDNPVSCAVALFPDGTVGMLVDKQRSGKSLAQELRKMGQTGSVYYGKAFADDDAGPGTLCLALNGAPSSLANKLQKEIRGSGFHKVEIQRELFADV
jgi:hypothetical protein